MDRRDRRFRILAAATVAAVYFLILVGGIVRASGSGMGCPDWPRCFGRWIPPTHESQLPADYQDRYAHRGYDDVRFNAAKTWTEYINRLIGVVIGLLIFATLLASMTFWRRDRAIVWLSLAAFLLVGFQGWLGSVVVSTNLAPWMVTVHMLVALVIVALLIQVLVRSRRDAAAAAQSGLASGGAVRWALGLVLLLSLVQIGLGTQVRERVDEVAAAGDLARAEWVGELGGVYLAHRVFALIVVAANLWLLWLLRRSGALASGHPVERRLSVAVVGLLLAEAVVGVLLSAFALPAVLQPVHLLLASLLAGAQLALAATCGSSAGRVPRLVAAGTAS